VVVGALPLEGENQDDERLTAIEPEANSETPNVVAETPILEAEPIAEGRGKRIRKETEYVRLLKEGSGVTGNRASEILPRGMQHGTVTTGGGSKDDHAVVAGGPEIDYAMAMVIESAEGLMPSYEEAWKRPDWPKWDEAIQKELKGLENSRTWRLVKRPPDANVVDCKWVLRIKKNAAGEIDKYKARLVARGFTQIYGVDYYETYSPVARLASFRLLMAVAAQNGWAIDAFDFDSAFLSSELGEDEVIYLEQPAGYETRDRKSWVWRLLKALYGLK
jgi:hypothetical protein